IVPGSTVDYIVTVANVGPSVAREVVFFESPEEGSAPNSGRPRPELIQAMQAPSGAQCQNEQLLDNVTNEIFSIRVCTIPELEPGGSRVFTVRAVFPPDFQIGSGGSTITNTAQVISVELDSDPDTNDFTGSVTSTVARQVDIAVTKSGPVAVVAGNA